MTDSTTGFTDRDWKRLFHYIDHSNTTPFLGAGVAIEHFGSGNDLAEEIANEFGYPFSEISNLANVAQFATIRENRDSLRIRDFVADYIKGKQLPDFDDPLEPHRILARLDLPIYITTNFDHLMFEALKSDGKDPTIETCRWNDSLRLEGKGSVLDKPHKFDSNNPLVYHIHGEVDNPQTMVLTEDDYLNFIVELSVDFEKLIPAEIRLKLFASSIIFIGYSMSDWNLRMILRKIAKGIKSASTTHCSIQLVPLDIKEGEEETIKEDLKSYFEIIQAAHLNIFWGTAIEFCRTLSEKSENLRGKLNVHTT